MGPPRSFATATLPSWSGSSFQIVCSYSGCFSSSSAVSGAIFDMLDAKSRTDDCALVNVQSKEFGLVVPSDQAATSVAQPQHITLASPIWGYCRSAAGSDPSTIMPDAHHVTFRGTHRVCRCAKDEGSNRCGDEVELKLFNAGRLPSMDAEAPQGLAELGRNDQTKPYLEAIAASRANNG